MEGGFEFEAASRDVRKLLALDSQRRLRIDHRARLVDPLLFDQDTTAQKKS